MVTTIIAAVLLYLIISCIAAFVGGFDAGFWETLPYALLWPLAILYTIWIPLVFAIFGYVLCVATSGHWTLWT